MNLSQFKLLRRFLLPLLRRMNPGDITIKHHYTKQKLRLHSFKHKGYWYYGAQRERDTMEFFKSCIAKNDTVYEIGGHIGYITQFFAMLVGEQGQVVVFEPGENNLAYLRANTKMFPNVSVVDKAVSNEVGRVRFYLDDLTGQNNSMVENYEQLAAMQKNAYIDTKVKQVEVESVTIDSLLCDTRRPPDFVKIDIEGAEFLALQGMTHCLKETRPAMMIEVTDQCDEVQKLMESFGYALLDAGGKRLASGGRNSGNVFFLHQERHAELLRVC